MPRPKTVRLDPFTYKVTFVTILPEAVGHSATDVGEIQVSESQTEENQRSTLVHEILHAIIGQGLREFLREPDPKFEEQIVALLEPRLFGLIRDNPKLIDYLQEK